jgi:GR25 family glycosyltransferase involved in LPS biosynthesis
MFSILGNTLANKGFYINLDTSLDRKERVEKTILDYDIKGLERFDALRDNWIQFSCTKSHLAVFKQSLEEDLDVIFVAEDDFQIDEICYQPNVNETLYFKDVIQKVKNDLDNIEWDVVLFGCNPKSYLVPVTENLALNSKSTGAWAYLIRKNAYKFILENSNYAKDYLAIDDYLPHLNNNGFTCLTTIPLTINHGINLESTLQPRGLVNYDSWIKGNYEKFLYSVYKNKNLMDKTIEKDVTIVITGHMVDNFLYYLNYLLHSLPTELNKCKFLVNYDVDDNNPNSGYDKINLQRYFYDHRSDLNVTITYSFGGLISSIGNVIEQIKTPYFIFLEHDWVFLEKDNINFLELVKAFDEHSFINAVWFAKDDNVMRGFEIARDVDNVTTPFERDSRVNNVDLVTSCRWSNNPVIFRLSKMKEWYYQIILNEHVGKLHQGQHNVEETMIKYYRDVISCNRWIDIRDNWGTFLYGNLGEGPYVGHTDASKRYQGHSKSQPEINGEKYINDNPLTNYTIFKI